MTGQQYVVQAVRSSLDLARGSPAPSARSPLLTPRLPSGGPEGPLGDLPELVEGLRQSLGRLDSSVQEALRRHGSGHSAGSSVHYTGLPRQRSWSDGPGSAGGPGGVVVAAAGPRSAPATESGDGTPAQGLSAGLGDCGVDMVQLAALAAAALAGVGGATPGHSHNASGSGLSSREVSGLDLTSLLASSRDATDGGGPHPPVPSVTRLSVPLEFERRHGMALGGSGASPPCSDGPLASGDGSNSLPLHPPFGGATPEGLSLLQQQHYQLLLLQQQHVQQYAQQQAQQYAQAQQQQQHPPPLYPGGGSILAQHAALLASLSLGSESGEAGSHNSDLLSVRPSATGQCPAVFFFSFVAVVAWCWFPHPPPVCLPLLPHPAGLEPR